MHTILPLLCDTDFPSITRRNTEILQVNLGYRCNQSCVHCHVAASPARTEQMSGETVDTVIRFLQRHAILTLDLTGGAPELNQHFRRLVAAARGLGVHVIDRCNLSILSEPQQEDLAAFLAAHHVKIVASLPCYLEENVERQRGKGVFQASLNGLHLLNKFGYGSGNGLVLDLVFNPQGPVLPPPQKALEADYKRILNDQYSIVFDKLYTITNMPIQRFGATLVSKKQFEDYLALLKSAYSERNLEHVMCRNLISIDWRGYVYDCDFNQMLDLPLIYAGQRQIHLSELDADLAGLSIQVAEHCYGCVAGQGSSCCGALEEKSIIT